MILERKSKHKKVLLSIFIVLIIIGLGIWLLAKPSDNTPVNDTITNQEEAVCNTDCAIIPDGWTATSTNAGLNFAYPEALGADYISTVNWPPNISSSQETFNCNITDSSSSLPNRVILVQVDNQEYCVSAKSEGAAGSVYTSYTYKTKWQDQLLSIDFTLRYPQCYNYPDLEQGLCTSERESFDLNALVNNIVYTVNFNK